MNYKKYNTTLFTNNDANSYYLLGLFITDGNQYGGESSLSSIDFTLLKSINLLLSEDNLISKKKNSNCFRLRIHNKIIYNWLINNNCVPNKTKIVKFPNVPNQYMSDFIRGLIDGDGSIGIYNKICLVRFDSASDSLIYELSNFFNNIGIGNKVSLSKWIESEINGKKIKSTTQMYRISFSGLKSYKLLKFIYNKNVGLFLDRKKDIAEKIFSIFEGKGFSEQELLNLDKLPIIKWDDEKLIEDCFKYKGVFKDIAKEYNVAAWTISCRLKK